VILLVAVVTSACSTTESRIEANRQNYDKFPAEVQQAIQRGEVLPGFTREQVFIALGEPWSREADHSIYAGCNWRTVRTLTPELVWRREYRRAWNRHVEKYGTGSTVTFSAPLRYRDQRLCRRYIDQVVYFEGDRVTYTERPPEIVWLEPGWR